MLLIELIPPFIAAVFLFVLAFLQAEANDITDLLGKFNTPLSVGITLWFCKVIFTAWREDAQKAREDSQKFFETLKELITSLESERKTELSELTKSFDNLAGSINELVTKVTDGK